MRLFFPTHNGVTQPPLVSPRCSWPSPRSAPSVFALLFLGRLQWVLARPPAHARGAFALLTAPHFCFRQFANPVPTDAPLVGSALAHRPQSLTLAKTKQLFHFSLGGLTAGSSAAARLRRRYQTKRHGQARKQPQKDSRERRPLQRETV